MSEALLRKDIKEKKIRNLYLFYGCEEYLKRNYIEYIEQNLLDEGTRLLNKVVLEDNVTVTSIVDNCETLPVFSDRRMVVVKKSGLFKGKKAKGSAKGRDDDEFATFLKNVPNHVCLIFSEAEIDKRNKAVDIVKENGLIVEFEYRKPDELAAWAVKMARKQGCEMDAKTSAYLVEYCDSGMDDVLNEINKLCAYVAGRKKITQEDIERVCTRSIKSRIFDLTDAIARLQADKALAILDDMIALKEPIPRIIFMIAKQLRQMLQINLMLKEGATRDEITEKLGLNRYFAAKTINQARMFPIEKLEKAIETGLALDMAIKTGRIRDRAAVELMITHMSR